MRGALLLLISTFIACSSDERAAPAPTTPTTSTTPDSGMPTTTPPPVATDAGSTWPGPTNTGVPAGTTLTKYTGSCDIRTDNLVIDAKTIACSMLVYAKGVVIRRSKVTGTVRTNADTATIAIEDSEVDGGDDQSEAVGLDNVTVLRSNIHGNQHTVHCNSNCVVKDSWLHDQHDGAALDWHQNGFLSNGGSSFRIEHNTVGCVGGCTADIAFINDDDVSDGIIQNNLLLASPSSSFCSYPTGSTTSSKPGKVSKMVWKNNVFQRGANGKCATYGPIYEFTNGSGNEWSGNTWEDGAALEP